MSTITRRRALALSTALVPVILLEGCAGTTLSQLAQYAQAAGNAAQAIVNAVAPSTLTAQISGYITTIETAAAAIVKGTPTSGTVSWPQQLYDGAKALLPIAAPLLGAIPGAGIALAAIQALMPVIAQLAGLTAAAQATVPVPGLPPMTAAQALKLYGPGV